VSTEQNLKIWKIISSQPFLTNRRHSTALFPYIKISFYKEISSKQIKMTITLPVLEIFSSSNFYFCHNSLLGKLTPLARACNSYICLRPILSNFSSTSSKYENLMNNKAFYTQKNKIKFFSADDGITNIAIFNF